MPCRQFKGTPCGGCCHFIKSNSITLVGNVLVINIPQQTFSNRQKACICIAQAIPAGVTSANTVAVTIGTSATQYPLFTRCFNLVHADQIKCRKVYHTYAVTDIPGFVVEDKLCCTAFNFPVIPATVTEPPAEVVAVSEKKVK